MQFIVDNEDTTTRDVHGGPITEENAFFLMTNALDGEPDLSSLPLHGCQRRKGNTADSKFATARVKKIEGQRSMIYKVWRVA